MKNGPDRIEPSTAGDEFVNRKLIRPTRTDGSGAAVAPALSDGARSRGALTGKRAHAAAEQTHAENFYFQKQMQAHTSISILLKTGETVQGTIEWYDKNCIKIARPGKPNLLVYKQAIRYLHKTEE